MGEKKNRKNETKREKEKTFAHIQCDGGDTGIFMLHRMTAYNDINLSCLILVLEEIKQTL